MKNRHSIFITSILSLFLLSNTYGQDVAIAGFNFDSNDGFALVALVDIPASQNIFVTDAPYQSGTNTFDGTASPNESTLRITWTGTWTKGTIIEVEETGSSTFTVTSSTNGPSMPMATLPYFGDGFSLANDGISVFTASSTSDPDNTVTEIHAYISTSGGAGADPDPSTDANCPCSASFVSLDISDLNLDHAQYTPALRGMSIDLANYNNIANWTTAEPNVSLSQTEFTNIMFGGSGLPVTLTSFTGKVKGQSSLLQWQTSLEENNHYFQIEHSLDGREFNEIGRVMGNGNSVETIDYSYLDTKPNRGINYYRLKQVDYNGQFEYSRVVAVDFSGDQVVSVYPNPFDQSVTIQFPASDNDFSANQDWTIEVVDVYGKLVHSVLIPASEINTTLNLSELFSGTYFIRTIDANQNVLTTQRVVKL